MQYTPPFDPKDYPLKPWLGEKAKPIPREDFLLEEDIDWINSHLELSNEKYD